MEFENSIGSVEIKETAIIFNDSTNKNPKIIHLSPSEQIHLENLIELFVLHFPSKSKN